MSEQEIPKGLDEYQAQRFAKWAQELDVKYRYRNATFAPLDDSTLDGLRKWRQALVYDHAEDWGAPAVTGPNLIISGPVGPGKTYALHALSRSMWTREFRHLYIVNEVEMMAEIGNFDNNKAVKEFVDLNLLAVDDLGKSDDAWAKRTLYRICNGRFEQQRPTVYTTNMTYDEVFKGYGESVASRIWGGAVEVEVLGDDRRFTE